MKQLIVFSVLVFLLSACANSKYLANDCYLGEVNPKDNSYSQVCFVGPGDPRGRIIFYSSVPVFAGSSLNKEMLCKQRFDFVRENSLVKLDLKAGECGVRDNYARATQYTIMDEKSFNARIETCLFKDLNTLSCYRTNLDKTEIFRKTVNAD